MDYFFESPWFWLVGGILVEGTLAVVLINTGQGKILFFMGLVALVSLGGLAAEQWVVTDREQVEGTLDRARIALEANDAAGLLQLMAPEAGNLRERVNSALPRYTITAARIGGLKIDFTSTSEPKSAVAQFTARVTGRDQGGEVPYDTYVGRFTIELRQEGDRWLMYDYQESEVGGGL